MIGLYKVRPLAYLPAKDQRHMDIFSRIYHILRARAGADDEPLAGGAWREFTREGSSQQEPLGEDPVLAKFYANLEIPYGSDLATAKAAWKNLMKKYHPDRHSQDAEKRKVANELSAELTRAYQELERALAPSG